MSGWPAVLRPGDWVTFNGDEHQVCAVLSGFRLRHPDLGCESLPGFGPLAANNVDL
jgi:hypothetical protein